MSGSNSLFKPPPTVECLCQEHCLGFGKKVYNPNLVCDDCLKRHEPQQLYVWAQDNTSATLVINEEIARKQLLKQNIESHGRYLCAFEDPDFQHCRWRQSDLNLRDTRLNCTSARRKGAACSRCWKRRLSKIHIAQYFTPTGLCHEEADKAVMSSQGPEEGTGVEDDDVEGYNAALV